MDRALQPGDRVRHVPSGRVGVVHMTTGDAAIVNHGPTWQTVYALADLEPVEQDGER